MSKKEVKNKEILGEFVDDADVPLSVEAERRFSLKGPSLELALAIAFLANKARVSAGLKPLKESVIFQQFYNQVCGGLFKPVSRIYIRPEIHASERKPWKSQDFSEFGSMDEFLDLVRSMMVESDVLSGSGKPEPDLEEEEEELSDAEDQLGLPLAGVPTVVVDDQSQQSTEEDEIARRRRELQGS